MRTAVGCYKHWTSKHDQHPWGLQTGPTIMGSTDDNYGACGRHKPTLICGSSWVLFYVIYSEFENGRTRICRFRNWQRLLDTTGGPNINVRMDQQRFDRWTANSATVIWITSKFLFHILNFNMDKVKLNYDLFFQNFLNIFQLTRFQLRAKQVSHQHLYLNKEP